MFIQCFFKHYSQYSVEVCLNYNISGDITIVSVKRAFLKSYLE